MGTLVAVIIIVSLIFFALKDLLDNHDFSAWTSTALTALILFTVILSVYMIMGNPLKPKEARPAPETQEDLARREEMPSYIDPLVMSDEQAQKAMAAEYATIKSDYAKNNPQATGQEAHDFTSEYMINKYGLTNDEWQAFLQASQELMEQAAGQTPR
ncbi:MAG: hypothetical protein LBR90_00065 [Elusimicrobiota bacterium]|jgi:hypothetical protein|nr:hypothetical protein [Elusimicrobiota bacterium]